MRQGFGIAFVGLVLAQPRRGRCLLPGRLVQAPVHGDGGLESCRFHSGGPRRGGGTEALRDGRGRHCQEGEENGDDGSGNADETTPGPKWNGRARPFDGTGAQVVVSGAAGRTWTASRFSGLPSRAQCPSRSWLPCDAVENLVEPGSRAPPQNATDMVTPGVTIGAQCAVPGFRAASGVPQFEAESPTVGEPHSQA